MVHQEQENQTTVQMQNPIDVQDESEVTYQEQENQTTNTTDDNQNNRPDQETTVSDVQMQNPTDVQDDREVTFIGQASMTDPVLLKDTFPWEDSKPVLVIVVRRGHCLADLMMAFVDPEVMNKDINVKRKLPNGQLEEGEGSGVLRDCLTEFWGDFYSKCTLGTNVKTPYIRLMADACVRVQG